MKENQERAKVIHFKKGNWKMVGFMRNFKHPPHMASLTAKLCAYYGLMLVYMRPNDVDIESHKVKGKIYLENGWKTAEVDVPRFIDVSPYCFKRKHKEVMDYLEEKTQLSNAGRYGFDKKALQTYLHGIENFKHLVIPTTKVNMFSDMEDFVEQHEVIVMKPLGGEQGKGVYILTKKEKNQYILGHQKTERLLSTQELKKFFEEKIKDKRYILQKYICSRSIQGDPFDCRIHMEKNGEGKWVNAKNYIRIGIGQKVVSNVSQGGGISDLNPFLKANFGDQAAKVKSRIIKLADSLPYTLEKRRNHKMMTLGMDIGIDKDGSLYLFEVNTAPITHPLRDIAVTLRVEYYQYMLNMKVQNGHVTTNPIKLNEELRNMKKESIKITKENKRIKKESERLKRENKRLKKSCNKIENSTSWKITRPIRSIGKLIKRS